MAVMVIGADAWQVVPLVAGAWIEMEGGVVSFCTGMFSVKAYADMPVAVTVKVKFIGVPATEAPRVTLKGDVLFLRVPAEIAPQDRHTAGMTVALDVKDVKTPVTFDKLVVPVFFNVTSN